MLSWIMVNYRRSVNGLVMTDEAKKRSKWIKLYEQYGNAGVVRLKVGISRPTLRKWLRRYKEQSLIGLESQRRRLHSTLRKKIFGSERYKILELRTKRRLGARRMQSELIRHSGLRFSLATIHEVLH